MATVANVRARGAYAPSVPPRCRCAICRGLTRATRELDRLLHDADRAARRLERAREIHERHLRRITKGTA